MGLSLAAMPPNVRAQDAPSAQAVASRDPDGVGIRYRLSQPRDHVVFTDRDTIRDRWSIATPGLTRADAGRVIYGPGLAIDGLPVALPFDLAEGEISRPNARWAATPMSILMRM